MSTITKERAQEIFLGNGPEPTASEERELARIALVSLEAKPVAFVMADDLKDSSIISTPAYRDLGEAMERTVGDVVALYAIHPAPESLDAGDKLSNFIASQELLGKDFEKVLAENIEGLYVPGNTATPAPVSEREPVQMFGIGSVFKPQILSVDEVDCHNCEHYQPNVCHGEGCLAAMLQGGKS